MKHKYSLVFKPNEGQWQEAKKQITILCENAFRSRNKIVAHILSQNLTLEQAQFLFTKQTGLDLKTYGLKSDADLKILNFNGSELLSGANLELSEDKLIKIKSSDIKTLDLLLILKYIEDYRIWQKGAYALTYDNHLIRKFGQKNKSYVKWFKKHQNLEF